MLHWHTKGRATNLKAQWPVEVSALGKVGVGPKLFAINGSSSLWSHILCGSEKFPAIYIRLSESHPL